MCLDYLLRFHRSRVVLHIFLSFGADLDIPGASSRGFVKFACLQGLRIDPRVSEHGVEAGK